MGGAQRECACVEPARGDLGHASVEIVDSQPRRVFDRAVSRTLSRWTYEPGAPGRTTDVEIAFDRE